MPAMLKQPKPISRFLGLNTVSDPLDLGWGWQAVADNVDITDAGKMAKRAGYSLAAAGDFGAAYATRDAKRLYAVEDGALVAVTPDLNRIVLAEVGTAPMYWAETNGEVHFNNGTAAGIVRPDGEVLDLMWAVPPEPNLAAVTGSLAPGLYRVCLTTILADGRETGAGDYAELQIAEGEALQITGVPVSSRVYIAPADSTVFQFGGAADMVWNADPSALGTELETDGLEPMPTGCEAIAIFQGRLYAAEYLAHADKTVIWESEPLKYHLFNTAERALMFPGHVLLLADTKDALVIGTEREIHAYDGDAPALLAAYGVIAGQHAPVDADDTRYFWTARGLCKCMPFTNLTPQISVAPGLSAAAGLVEAGGQKRFVASLVAGDAAFNAFN